MLTIRVDGAGGDILPVAEEVIASNELDELKRLVVELQEENDRLRALLFELERIAQRDTLTPLYNRRHFLAAIKKRLSLLSDGEERGAVVFMDVDELKSINDRFGHAAGDYALLEIASRVDALVLAGEIAARIGGDEFGFLINGDDREEAEQRVARMSAALTEKPAVFKGISINLSACFGVAMLRGGQSGVSVLAEADRNMYRAKAAGIRAEWGSHQGA